MVYFIEDKSSRAIKIGVANDPAARLAELQVGNPDRLVLLGAIPGGYADEMKLHERFADHRCGGEWFRDHPSIRAAIGELIARYGMTSGSRPAPAPSRDSYMAVKRSWERLIEAQTGLKTSIAQWNLSILAGKSRPDSYSVDEEFGPGCPGGFDDFWVWYLDNCYRLYPTMRLASEAFVKSFEFWRDTQEGK